jgi:hypothetical protein
MSAPCPVLGFIVRLKAEDAVGILADLHALLDANGLATDRSLNARELPIYRDGSQATDGDRQIIQEWAKRCAVDVEVSDLIDLNRGA